MATHFSIPAWRIPGTEELGRRQSTGSQSQTRMSTHRHNSILEGLCTDHYLFVLEFSFRDVAIKPSSPT